MDSPRGVGCGHQTSALSVALRGEPLVEGSENYKAQDDLGLELHACIHAAKILRSAAPTCLRELLSQGIVYFNASFSGSYQSPEIIQNDWVAVQRNRIVYYISLLKSFRSSSLKATQTKGHASSRSSAEPGVQVPVQASLPLAEHLDDQLT